MQAIITVTIPFFALVLCGYLAARQGLLPRNAVPGLNAFVLYFALPCMLYRFGARTPVLELLNPTVLAVYLLAAGVLVFFTIAMTLSPGVGLKDAAFGALVAAFPNTGFMGVPLLVALLGPAAAGTVICIILADMIVTTSVCLGLASAHDASGAGPRAAVLTALRGAMRNPLAWAIALGGAAGVIGLALPGPLDTVVRMLADAASPVALFTIGAVLWRSSHLTSPETAPEAISSFIPTAPLRLADMAASGTQLSAWPSTDGGGMAPTTPHTVIVSPTPPPARPPAPRSQVLAVALVKLLLHPLAIVLFGASARALGAPLTPFQLTVLTLAAALPSASNVSLLAERHGADTGRIARIIMLSTVLAFASFTLIAWALRVKPAL